MSKRCEFCGRYFVPDPRVGDRQRSCPRSECQDARKRSSKRAWRERETPNGYFTGRYAYVKQWRKKRRSMIQDEIPPAKPMQKLVFWVPGTNSRMIQDEIRLRRVAGNDFAAHGITKEMIQDTMARSP